MNGREARESGLWLKASIALLAAGIRCPLKNSDPAHYLEEQFRKVSGGLLIRLERPRDARQGLLGGRAKDGSNAALRNGNGSWSGQLPAPWRACAG